MQYHRPATASDAAFVAANLRPADREECRAATGMDPSTVLDHAVEHSNSEAIIAPTGEVIGLCGVIPSTIPGHGTVWMVGTTAIPKYSRLFIRAGRVWLAKKHKRFPHLGNIVDARNELHVKWLAKMGFKFTTAILHGPLSLPFIQFERTA